MSDIKWETLTREQIMDLYEPALAQHNNPLNGIFNQRSALNWYRGECERLTALLSRNMDELDTQYNLVNKQKSKIATLTANVKTLRKALAIRKKAKKKTPNLRKIK